MPESINLLSLTLLAYPRAIIIKTKQVSDTKWAPSYLFTRLLNNAIMLNGNHSLRMKAFQNILHKLPRMTLCHTNESSGCHKKGPLYRVKRNDLNQLFSFASPPGTLSLSFYLKHVPTCAQQRQPSCSLKVDNYRLTDQSMPPFVHYLAPLLFILVIHTVCIYVGTYFCVYSEACKK